MRLVIDANVLVSELLHSRGQALIAHSELQLSIAAYTWGEAEHELRKRLTGRFVHNGQGVERVEFFLFGAMALVTQRIAVMPEGFYVSHETVARMRIPRDPDDWHTVALALTYGPNEAAIWTGDADFLGCGIATWTTDTLLAHLAYVEAEE
ncbi:MAG: PIN domain-containing protein [Thermomicrobiales bacterium]